MTETSGFFDSYYYEEGDTVTTAPTYQPTQVAELIRGVLRDGYWNLEVGAPGGMFVEVGSGYGWVHGYWYYNDAAKSLAVAPTTTNPRIDLVVIRNSIIGARTITTVILQGTAAAIPVAPTLTQNETTWETLVATLTIPTGTSSAITSGMISNAETGMSVLKMLLSDMDAYDGTISMSNHKITGSAICSSAQDGCTLAYAQSKGIPDEPIGIMTWHGGSSPPTGWVECNGQSLLRTGTYAALYAVIGTTYGAADGSHFNVPDTRGKMIYNTGTQAATGGTKTETLALANMPIHNHYGVHYRTSTGDGQHYTPSSCANGAYGRLTTDSKGGGGAHQNLPPYIVLRAIMRYV